MKDYYQFSSLRSFSNFKLISSMALNLHMVNGVKCLKFEISNEGLFAFSMEQFEMLREAASLSFQSTDNVIRSIRNFKELFTDAVSKMRKRGDGVLDLMFCVRFYVF
jgi:hypothetical protein